MLQKTTPTTDDVKNRCLAIIDKYHHREALREDDIRAWVSHVVGEHGDAAVWHAARAAGFGGSDIGVLARNYSGHRADHQVSARDIVASKLLKEVPSEDSGDLRRGHDNEPLHAQRFYEKYAAKRDEVAFETLTKSQGLRRWMRYSPDDVVLLPAANPNPALNGQYFVRLLIDYKAPRRVEEDDSIAFQYACQLHQGAMICAKAGVHLDGLMLSQFDWAGWALKDDNIPYDPEISKLILKAGDHYFDYVMRGDLPPYIFTPKFDREAEFIEAFGAKAQRLAHLSAVGKAFMDEAELVASEIKASLKDVRLAGKRMQLGDLGVTAVNMVDHQKINELLGKDGVADVRKKGGKPEYDAAAMVMKLRELGHDVNVYRIDKIDADIAYPVLIDKGFDPEAFMTEQIRFKVAEHLKESARQLVQASFPKEAAIEQPAEVIEQPQIVVVQDLADQTAEQDVREGQFTERQAQRTSMV